jgi:hypothetical protein
MKVKPMVYAFGERVENVVDYPKLYCFQT